MAITTRILGVSGSQRGFSHSRYLLSRLLKEADGFGATTQLLDLRATPLSMLQPDNYDASTNYAEIRELVLWADVIVLCSPDYHGSMAAPIKNFLDHFWEEFAGKLFGYVVATHEKGLTVQDQMRTAVRQCYAWSLPYGIGFVGGHDIDPAKETIAPALEARIRMMARDLTVYGELIYGQFKNDLALETAPPSFSAKFRENTDD